MPDPVFFIIESPLLNDVPLVAMLLGAIVLCVHIYFLVVAPDTVTVVACDLAYVLFPFGLNVGVGAVLSKLYGP